MFVFCRKEVFSILKARWIDRQYHHTSDLGILGFCCCCLFVCLFCFLLLFFFRKEGRKFSHFSRQVETMNNIIKQAVLEFRGFVVAVVVCFCLFVCLFSFVGRKFSQFSRQYETMPSNEPSRNSGCFFFCGKEVFTNLGDICFQS